MSVNVLVIPEDFHIDQHILGPIIKKMMQEFGVKARRVRICTDPRLHGVSEALDWEHLKVIIERYRGMVQLFLLVVDRDGDANRAATLRMLEEKAREELGDDTWFFADHAWQELEVWVLAGMDDLPKDWSWREIREERDPKERYYQPYAEIRGKIGEPYQGRKTLAKEAAGNYDRIRRLCAEDIQALEERIRKALHG